jgi:hypothetical protein
MKFDIRGFFEFFFSVTFNLQVTSIKITAVSHEYLHVSMIIPLSLLLRIRKLSDKILGKVKTRFTVFNNFFPPPKIVLFMRHAENTLQPDRS